MNKILFFGEPLIRLSPQNYETIGNNVTSKMFFGGSEINIARNLQGFNITTKVFTALPNNPIGTSFIDFLNQSNIDTTSICRTGNRIGVYYLENGIGCRQSEVYYDRKYTSIEDIDISTLEMDNLFKDITHFHFSGITIAVSSKVREILTILLNEAKKRNITISIDLNLRTKMINVHDAKIEFSKFAKYADYCFGIDPIMADENDLNMFDRFNATDIDIQNRMSKLKDIYNFKAIFHTIRQTDVNGLNIYKCYGFDNKLEISTQLKTTVLQRVGSGDAFVAGALYKILNNAPIKEIIDFAIASGTYKCTVEGDNMYVSASKIEEILKNNQDIVR